MPTDQAHWTSPAGLSTWAGQRGHLQVHELDSAQVLLQHALEHRAPAMAELALIPAQSVGLASAHSLLSQRGLGLHPGQCACMAVARRHSR